MKFEFNAFEVKKIHSDKLEPMLELLFQNDLPAFRNNNSNMGSNLSEWIFFTSNALNSNFIQDGEVNLIIITEIAFFFFLPCTILFGTEEPGLTCPTGIKTCAQWGARKHNRRMVITNSAFW